MSKLFVGNISWDATEEDIRKAFKAIGTVLEVKLVNDREKPGRHKGFGFVTMDSDEEAMRAIEELDGKEIAGRAVVVSKAREREERN